MNKTRTNVNGVYTPTMKYTFDDSTNTSITIANNVDHKNQWNNDFSDDSKRLKISMYGDNINMTGLYKHGFTIEADNATEAIRLGQYFLTIAFKLMRWDERLIETGHYATTHPKYDKENAKMYVIDDIYDTETIQELEALKDSFKGWMREEEVKSAFERQYCKLSGGNEPIKRQTNKSYAEDTSRAFNEAFPEIKGEAV